MPPLSVHLNLTQILTDLADVLSVEGNAADAYGVQSAAQVNLNTLDTGLACRLLPLAPARGKGIEQKKGAKYSLGYFSIFIMPWSGPNGETFNEHLWLKVAGKYYDINLVIDPVIDGAPYELFVEEVKP